MDVYVSLLSEICCAVDRAELALLAIYVVSAALI